jgi:hypothetical protein
MKAYRFVYVAGFLIGEHDAGFLIGYNGFWYPEVTASNAYANANWPDFLDW